MPTNENMNRPAATETARPKGFDELPPKTRQFLSELDQEDIVVLQEWMDIVRSARVIGGLAKVGIATLVASVLGAVAIYEAGMKIATWFSAPRSP